VFVCLLILSVNHAKTAELIEISFGMWTCVGPENHGYWGIGITHEKGHFRASYLGMLIKLYHQPYSLGGDGDAACGYQYCTYLFNR